MGHCTKVKHNEVICNNSTQVRNHMVFITELQIKATATGDENYSYNYCICNTVAIRNFNY